MRRFLLGLTLVSAAACNASVGGPAVTPDDGTGPRRRQDDGSEPHRLELLSESDVSLSRGMSATLRARYLDPDGNVADGPVYFDLDGDAEGATLQAGGVETDDDGVAEVELRAGQADATFDVVVSADYAHEVRASVTVTEDGAGDLRIEAIYEGSRRVYGADVYLYDERECDDIEADSPPPADRLETVASIRDEAKITALETGSTWSVLVLGIGEAGHPVVVGCAPEATIVGGQETVVQVPLTELPITFVGPFAVESHFAIADSMPEGAQDLLSVLSEIADDPNDPATYLLDLLGDQIDNEVLRFAYQGARIVTGIDEAINDVIMDWMPDFVWDALRAGDDLADALDDAQVDSTLTVDAPSAGDEDGGTRTARHQLVDLVLELDGTTHRFSMSDVGVNDASVDDVPIVIEDEETARIGNHSFRVGLGTLTRFAMNEVVLPRFEGSPDNLAEFVAGAMPCEWLGEELADWVGVGDDGFWEGVCELGSAMMGQYAEARLLELNDRYDTLTLEGHAEIGDQNKDLAIDALDDGHWNAQMTGPAGAFPIAGTFEGRGTNPESHTSNR